jgi:methyl-accepting chemotaxis protein
MKKKSLRFRLIVVGILIATVPLLVTALVTWCQMTQVKEKVSDTVIDLSSKDYSHLAESILDQARVAQKLLNEEVEKILSMAGNELKNAGGFKLSEETVAWTAVNQLDKTAVQVNLPKVHVGEHWLGQIDDAGQTVSVVDVVRRVTGDTSTIFQRMNERGDMLRVATNVIGANGKRAIGTYIPAVNPDGKPNPVLDKVLKGETYVGRAFVVDQWYLTAYKPLKDAAGKVEGILYVGVPEKAASTQLRDAIIARKIGKTGYIFVINATGESKGKYVISNQGKRDGENIIGAKDSNGRLFIQEIIDKALALKPGEVGSESYPWQNQGETTSRQKIAYFTYFAPWDWVIGVTAYEDEYMQVVYDIRSQIQNSLWIQVLIAVIAATVGSISFFLISSRISKEIADICRNLTSCSKESVAASHQVSSASQVLAEGSSEQAASLEETSASMEEMTGMTKRNAEHAQTGKGLAETTRKSAEQANHDIEVMSGALQAVGQSSDQLRVAMDKISSSSNEITQVMKTIDEIAFQTNILSLNAAVEAARAGEAGAGFAVVADEVRALAQRSADAAKQTARMIKESTDSSHQGMVVTQKVSEDLDNMVKTAQNVRTRLEEILAKARQVDEVIAEISMACQEQSQGIGQVSTALSQMDKVTQANAASAEETAAASEQLNAQAMELNHIVALLEELIDGQTRVIENGLASKGGQTVAANKPAQARGQLQAPARTNSPRQSTPAGKS